MMMPEVAGNPPGTEGTCFPEPEAARETAQENAQENAHEAAYDAAQGNAPLPCKRGFAASAVFGALDLGTNNCRLLIARRARDGDREFRVIDAFSRPVRLGEGLLESGCLSDAAIHRTLSALAICADKLGRRHVSVVRSVATEACRRARNGRDFIRRVYEETGLALDVISPAEEARLAVLGCQTLVDCQAERTLVFDIGGGSTEAIVVERCSEPEGGLPGLRIRCWLSIPWGVVSLYETEPSDCGTPDRRLAAFLRMKEKVAAHLAPLSGHCSEVHLLGTSGTVTTLASLSMGLLQYDRRLVDGSLQATRDLVALGRDLAAKSPAERAQIPGVGADRAELVVAGAAILEALTDLGRSAHIRVADRGIREGILRSLIARAEESAPLARPAGR